jgi:hypothetical protein
VKLSPPYPLVLLLLLFCLLATSYGAVIPLFEGPDENAHFGYIAYLHQMGRLPALTPETAAISHELVQQPPLYYGLAALLNRGQKLETARQLEHRNPYAGIGMSKRHTISQTPTLGRLCRFIWRAPWHWSVVC